MVKELNAGKRDLADAYVRSWPKTIKKLKKAIPNAKTVIPGHGKTGCQGLLYFTISLFK